MTAGCARCGDCCTSIYLTFGEALAEGWTSARLDGVPDPATADGWAYWVAHGWDASQRDKAIRWYRPDGSVRANADFVAAHWSKNEDGSWSCGAFDPASRQCTAHDQRPPVCRDYPWYGREPSREGAEGVHPNCSYLADLPPDQRPAGARPLIPLMVL